MAPHGKSVIVVVRVLKRNRANRIYIYRKGFIIGTGSCNYGYGKSRNVLSASWRSKKADGVIQSESEALKTRGGNRINPSQGQKKIIIPAQADRPEAKGVHASFLCLFVLFWSSTDWMLPTHSGEGNLLYSIYQFKC